MNAHTTLLQSGADLITLLERADLSPTRQRDLISAVRRIAELAGYTPATLNLDVGALRCTLAGINPVAVGLKPRSFATLRSTFAAAVEFAGIAEPRGRGFNDHDEEWRPLIATLRIHGDLMKALASFIGWCSRNGVGPNAVDDEVVLRFFDWLEGRTLHPRPKSPCWRIPPAWNKARSLITDWPQQSLQRVSFRLPSRYLRWEELSPQLRADADAYLDLRHAPDLFDENPHSPKRPLSPQSLANQKTHIRLAASVLVAGGIPADILTSLAQLVEPENFKRVLRHYHQQAERKPSSQAIQIAGTLVDVARFHVRVEKPVLDVLKAAARKLPSVPLDLSEKNKALLALLEDETTRARLLFLPETLVGEIATALKRGKRLDFVGAQAAIGVDILTLAPLRMKNLAPLNWRKNFREPAGARASMILYVPKEETKSRKRDLTFELPVEVAERIRWYRRTILPRLDADADGDLFVTRDGRRKSQETLSQQLTEIIRERVGVQMSPHKFRHFAATTYLEAHPDDFQTVTDLLGYAWARTALAYAGSSSRRASRVYGEHVIQQREALRLAAMRKGGK